MTSKPTEKMVSVATGIDDACLMMSVSNDLSRDETATATSPKMVSKAYALAMPGDVRMAAEAATRFLKSVNDRLSNGDNLAANPTVEKPTILFVVG